MSLNKKLQVFEHQPDAVLNQNNPVSGTKYTVLDTTKNVRIISIMAKVSWTVQPTPLEVWVTVDGQTLRWYVNNPVADRENTAVRWRPMGAGGTEDGVLEDALSTVAAFLLEGRSVKIEAEITGGTVSNLGARVKWAKM